MAGIILEIVTTLTDKNARLEQLQEAIRVAEAEKVQVLAEMEETVASSLLQPPEQAAMRQLFDLPAPAPVERPEPAAVISRKQPQVVASTSVEDKPRRPGRKPSGDKVTDEQFAAVYQGKGPAAAATFAEMGLRAAQRRMSRIAATTGG